MPLPACTARNKPAREVRDEYDEKRPFADCTLAKETAEVATSERERERAGWTVIVWGGAGAYSHFSGRLVAVLAGRGTAKAGAGSHVAAARARAASAEQSNEIKQLEDREEGLLRQLRAPVPCRGEAAVDARAGVEEVVRAAAVKRVPEKVLQDGSAQRRHAAPRGVNPLGDGAVLV